MTSIAHAWQDYRALRRRAFAGRCELSAAGKLTLALGMAALTGLAAQVRIPLPFTPVPVTGQVFAALLAGVLLGGGWGALSQGLYVAAGAAGLPWFAGLTGGWGVLCGVTGGYLFGMVLAAGLIGRVSDRRPAFRRLPAQLGLMMAGVAVIYLCGALQFAAVMRTGLRETLLLAVAPFVLIDLAKAVLAASISTALLPKEADGPAL